MQADYAAADASSSEEDHSGSEDGVSLPSYLYEDFSDLEDGCFTCPEEVRSQLSPVSSWSAAAHADSSCLDSCMRTRREYVIVALHGRKSVENSDQLIGSLTTVRCFLDGGV